MRIIILLAMAFFNFYVWAQESIENNSNVAEVSFYHIGPATIDCVIQAAQKQNVPANILLALASVENGKNGQFVENKNGSRDIGHFQINTIHWKPNGQFAKYAFITQQDVAWRGCYNAELAAWLLRQHINAPGQEFWTRVANYHSKTSEHNTIYRNKLIPLAIRWGDWLRQRYDNVSISYE